MKKKILILVITLLIAFFLGYFVKIYLSIFFVLTLIFAYVINRQVKRTIYCANRNIIDFMRDSQRNFDILIIGKKGINKKFKFDKESKILNLTQKKRSLFASYLFLIHNYSYLREDGKGTVYIATDNIHDNRLTVTIFDIFSFHPVIKMKLNAASSLIETFPVLYYFKKIRNKDFFTDGANVSIKERIDSFCKARNLNIIYINL